jgi:Short C-terminal domain
MGLIGGIARTAVVAGTATAVSNRVSRRQAERWAGQGQQYTPVQRVGYTEAPPQQAAPPPAAAPAPAPDRYAQLKELAQLKDQGVLTEQEFATEKQRILAG